MQQKIAKGGLLISEANTRKSKHRCLDRFLGMVVEILIGDEKEADLNSLASDRQG